MHKTCQELSSYLNIWHTKTSYAQEPLTHRFVDTVEKYLRETTPLHPKNLNRIVEKSMYAVIGEETFTPECEKIKNSLKMALITPQEAERMNPELFDKIYGKTIIAFLHKDLERKQYVSLMEEQYAGYCKSKQPWISCITKSI